MPSTTFIVILSLNQVYDWRTMVKQQKFSPLFSPLFLSQDGFQPVLLLHTCIPLRIIAKARSTMGQYWHPCIITTVHGIAVVVAWLSAYKFRSGVKMMEHSYLDDPMVNAFEWLISPEGPHHKTQVVWAGDYGGIEDGYDENLYGLGTDENHASPEGSGADYQYIVNHTKRCYIDKHAVDGEIHPLPLLTSETEGGGGGDYKGRNEHCLGTWARDVISVEKTAPEGFQEVSFEFRE